MLKGCVFFKVVSVLRYFFSHMNDFNSKTQDILFGSQHESLNLISRSFKNTRDSELDDRIYLGPEMTHNFSSKSCCIVYLLFPYWMYGIKLLYMLYLVSNLFFFFLKSYGSFFM